MTNRPLQPPLRVRSALSAAVYTFVLALPACSPAAAPPPTPSPAGTAFGMAIHGGAGTITRASMSAEQEAQYRAVLDQALHTGHRILAGGGSSLDAVEATIRVMEDAPLFNAGRGAVFTSEGRNELDAAIMDGRTLQAGAVAGVTHAKNPVSLARAVMEKSPHVMMVRDGAEAFGREHGIEMVPESYFFTEHRWNALQRALEQDGRPMPARPAGAPPPPGAAPRTPGHGDRRFGTVGAVALDRHGNLAAATSTGGMTNKRFGRVGDAPILGAGTYANQRCAVSATGHGEFFMRNVVAYDICARMMYTNTSLERAAHQVVMEKLVQQGGEGGIIAMDAHGNHALTFNSEGMYRGYIGADGRATIAIYRD